MSEHTAPVVVGLDLSLTATGVATIYQDGLGDADTVASKTMGGLLYGRTVRLNSLEVKIHQAVPMNAIVAIETPAHNQTSGHHHDRSGLWWLVVSGLIGSGHTVYEVATTQVKKYATGKGNASKMEVMAAAIKRYPQFDIANDNEADAVILAAFLRRALGHPIEESLPKVNIDALAKFKIEEE